MAHRELNRETEVSEEVRYGNDKETAAYVRISVMQLWRLRRNGSGFPQPTVVGRIKRTDFREVDRWIKTGPAPSKP